MEPKLSLPSEPIVKGPPQLAGEDDASMRWMSAKLRLYLHGTIWPLDGVASNIAASFEEVKIMLNEHMVMANSASLREQHGAIAGKIDTIFTFSCIDQHLLSSLLENLAWTLSTAGRFIGIAPGSTGLYQELRQGAMNWAEQNVLAVKKAIGPQFKFLHGRCFLIKPNSEKDSIIAAEKESQRTIDRVPVFAFSASLPMLTPGIYVWFAIEKRNVQASAKI